MDTKTAQNKTVGYSLNLSKLIHKSIFAISIVISGYFIRYLANALLAHHLTPATYGDFAVILSVSSMLAGLIHFGSADSILKFIPHYISTREWGKLLGFLKSHYSWILTISLFVITISASTIVILFILHRAGHINILEYHPIIFTFWLLPLIGLLIFQSKLLGSIRKPGWGLVSQKILPYLLFIIGLLLLAGYIAKISVYSVSIIFGFALLATLVLQFAAIRFYLPPEAIDAKPNFLRKYWLSVALKLMISNFLFLVIGKLDLIILEMVGPTERGVGIFAAIVTICLLLLLFTSALSFIISPILSMALSNASKHQFSKLIKNCNLIVIALGLITTLPIILFGKFLLGLFGSEYVSGYLPLIIVACAQFFSLISVVASIVLRVSAGQVTLINIFAVVLILMVVIDILTSIRHKEFYI